MSEFFGNQEFRGAGGELTAAEEAFIQSLALVGLPSVSKAGFVLSVNSAGTAFQLAASSGGSGGSSGTVTTVSVATSQGVSGSVANATTTPAITLVLGALTGITSINTLVIGATGIVTTGVWNGTVIAPAFGGTGVANNAASTITISGSFALALTLTNTTAVILPVSGTLVSSVTTANGVSASNTAGALSFTLGAITPTTVNGLAITANGTNTLNITAGKTLAVTQTLTLSGTDSTVMTFPTTSATLARTDAANTFTGHQTIEGVTTTGATGTGLLVFGTAPTFASTFILGTAGGTTGAINFKGTTSGTVTLSVVDAAGTWTMKLPTSAGSSGNFLSTDGSGNTSWSAGAAAKFGGTGADGALSISSGTTTLDATTTAILVKNYSSISITSTAKLAFSNPNANGTSIILKSQGGVTLTSSTNPNIDTRGMGGALGANGGASGFATVGGSGGGGGAGSATAGNAGGASITGNSTVSTAGTSGIGLMTLGGGGVSGTTAGGTGGTLPWLIGTVNWPYYKFIPLMPGGGGSGGGGGESIAGANGGAGGGALYIECGGAWNYTGTINVSGNNGSNGGSNGSRGGGGGGGGGSGSFAALYASLTSNAGTTTASGGTGGTGGGSAGTAGASGGDGGTGLKMTALNTEFV